MRTNREILFQKLVEAYFSSTYTTFRRLSKSHSNVDAADLNQSFWIEGVHPKSMEILQRIEERSPAYIVRMVNNYFIDNWRKSQKPDGRFMELKEELLGEKYTPDTPEAQAIMQQLHEECERDIENIYDLLRRSEVNQAIFLMMLDKCRNAEIAQRLGISKQSVEG